MSSNIRQLDDSASETLLNLPRSDFPKSKKEIHHVQPADAATNEDEDRLLLVRVPASLSLSQLQSSYILGETCSSDIPHTANANAQTYEEPAVEGNIHVPIPTRLIVDGNDKGKTLELMRVETSNTYILVPPVPVDSSSNGSAATTGSNEAAATDGSNKRQKTDKLTTMPARSVGLIPGEESPACFFLEPVALHKGHYASKLRWALSRWVYDPLDPPNGVFGYTLSELGHICRTSEYEIGYALKNGVFGAEDALVIPADETESGDGDEKRYGILSEEGRQTVSMAILSALLESDVNLAWHGDSTSQEGMDLSLIMKEVRTQWHNLEEDGVIQRESEEAPVLTDSKHEQVGESQSQFFTPAEFHKLKSGSNKSVLADEVIWNCLRSLVHTNNDDDGMPESVWLMPDQVAKLAAHNVFLRSSHSDGWKEDDFMESWNMCMPSISKYEPSLTLLEGIAVSEKKAGENGEYKMWRYFPEASLSLVPELRIKSMFAMCSEWTLEDALPYLSKFVVGDTSVDIESEVKSLLEKCARCSAERNGGPKYVLLSK